MTAKHKKTVNNFMYLLQFDHSILVSHNFMSIFTHVFTQNVQSEYLIAQNNLLLKRLKSSRSPFLESPSPQLVLPLIPQVPQSPNPSVPQSHYTPKGPKGHK